MLRCFGRISPVEDVVTWMGQGDTRFADLPTALRLEQLILPAVIAVAERWRRARGSSRTEPDRAGSVWYCPQGGMHGDQHGGGVEPVIERSGAADRAAVIEYAARPLAISRTTSACAVQRRRSSRGQR